ncbi:hypothetical protein DOJK_00910 [Patescibacteria group bacterium]|nr:hypothetical protein DOJK_00910 [Patescibacteria group bacterium]
MTPPQHFIISWVVANTATLDRRSRLCITLSGILPDIDGLGYFVDRANLRFDVYSHYYVQYHHLFGHNIFAGLLIAGVSAYLCQRKLTVFLLSLLAFHLHLLADLAGSMGGDGYQWPIYYLYPVLPDFMLTWSGQWELSSWKNSAIGVSFFCIALILAYYKRVTFFECFSKKLEAKVIEVMKQRSLFKD